MTRSKKRIIAFSLMVALVGIAVLQYWWQSRLKEENQSLQQQVLTLRSDSERLSNLLARAISAPTPQADSSKELLRLRGEVGAMRRQTNELQSRLAKAGADARPSAADQEPRVMPENYPQTAQAAAQSILDCFSQGDADRFFTCFGQPGAKEMYDKIFADERARKLIGMKVLGIGEPTTNRLAPDILMVPYKVRLLDGNEKELQLRLVQDPETRWWFFKGGL